MADRAASYKGALGKLWGGHLDPKLDSAPMVVSVFAGCGGSSLGYSAAGYRELLAVEWDRRVCETFRVNFPGVPVHEGDIVKLSGTDALHLAKVKPGELDVLDGSPPCQGFSIAGKRRIGDVRNRLFEEYVRLLQAFQPKVFVMENVSGLVKGKMVLVFAEMTRMLKASGYRIRCKLLDAKWYGVPQSRKRLIWIGVRENLDMEPSHPIAQTWPMAMGDALPHLAKARSQRINPWIDKGRPVPTISGLSRGYSVCFSEPSPTIQRGGIGGAWMQQMLVEAGAGMLLSEEDMREAAIRPTWQMHRVLSGKEASKHFDLVRPDLSRPSPVVMGDAGGSGTEMVHPIEMRKLAIPEVKLLQSFPLEFRVLGNFHEKWAQLGNAVPPLMMLAIAEHIRQKILGKAKKEGEHGQAVQG